MAVTDGFSKDRWRGLAWLRFQRRVRKTTRKVPTRGSEAQWVRDVIYIDMMQVVVDWAASRGMKVGFTKKPNGTYDPNEKTIIINSSALPEKQLHYMLHECGHHLIGMKEHHERFGLGYPMANNPEINGKFLHRMACLEEEFEAWNRGWKLARRLKLVIDKAEFDKTKADCIKTYIKWASKKTPK